MKKTNKEKPSKKRQTQPDIDAELLWNTGWTYIRHVVDTAREPFLILDNKLKVLSANEAFYRTFQVTARDTENKFVYKIGNGQWDIPELRKLLEEILPHESFFQDLEIEHVYPAIGKKVMLMNARQVFSPLAADSESPQLIILAMEDVTKQRMLEEKLEIYSKELEERVLGSTKRLEERLKKLEKKSTTTKKSKKK
jgi:PAS domain-containing protein